MSNPRPLSIRQASRCEWGYDEKPCRACEGKLHGAKRIAPGTMLLAFSELPLDDPHFVGPGRGHREQRIIPGWTATVIQKRLEGIVRIPLVGGDFIQIAWDKLKRGDI